MIPIRLEIKNFLPYRTPDTLLFEGIHLACLTGANGAGKTTLLRLLAGLAQPTTGPALVDGRAPADDAAFLRSVGYLAQEVPLYRRWNAEDHLALGAH
ncbi:ATP-binding cassette domain-containing protein, partial [Lacticaseibacillus rhamnosus]